MLYLYENENDKHFINILNRQYCNQNYGHSYIDHYQLITKEIDIIIRSIKFAQIINKNNIKNDNMIEYK